MTDRILFIDVLRGVGILGVLLSHAALYGVYYGEHNALRVLPEETILLLTPIILMITWTGLFALITGIVNAFTVYKRLERGIPLNVALTGPLVNATMVYGFHLVYRATFNHRSTGYQGEELFSFFTGYVETGHVVKITLMHFYLTEAFHMIAVTGWFTVFLMWVLWRDGGHRKHWRNFKILLTLSIVWLLVYSPLFNLVYPTYVSWFYKDQVIYYVITFVFMKAFWSGMQVLLPYGGFGALGLIYGTWFAYHEDFSLMTKITNIIGISFLMLGIIKLYIDLFILGVTIEELLDFHNLPPFLTWVNLGSMLLFMSWLIYAMEAQPHETRVRIAQKTIWVRQFGVLALTVFFFESFVHASIGRIFHAIFGSSDPSVTKDAFMFNPYAMTLYFLTVYAFWFTVLYLWRKVEFKWSLEYIFIRIAEHFRKVKSSRANLYEILIDPLGENRRVAEQIRSTRAQQVSPQVREEQVRD